MTQPALVFLPWVRRGGPLTLPPDSPAAHPPSSVGTTVAVSVNDGPEAGVAVQLLGPGDVTSVAPQQVIRTDPSPNSTAFESNYLALVEFDEPALPWLFTPAAASGGRLRPWLCLVVVREQSGVGLAPPSRGSLPVLRIGSPARVEDELPDLTDSWAWAHAQLAAEGVPSGSALAAALAGDPGRSLSRLVSGRLLAEQTSYLACVVPTFEAGRLTGLGLDAGSASGPAWTLKPGMPGVELPVYHHWRFATGPAGDFQSLALAIRGRGVPDEFGTRAIDLSTSGLPLTGVDDLQLLLGGALLALDSPAQRWSDPSKIAPFAAELRRVLNAPDDARPGEPLLAPPRYGATYREAPGLEVTGSRWYEQLNLDPGARIAAALGTAVVQRQQETLVAAAWDQAADLAAARRLYGLAGLGFAVADSLHRRHVAQLSDDFGLFVLAPLRARLLAAPATGADPSFGVQWAQAQVSAAALGTAVRRVTRTSGPVLRRVARTSPMPSRIDILGSMAPIARIERSFEPPSGPLTFDAVAPAGTLSWAGLTAEAITAAPPRRGFAITATPQPAGPPPPLPLPGGGGVFTGGVFTGGVLTGGVLSGDLTRPDSPGTDVPRPGPSRVGRPRPEPGASLRRPDDGGGPGPIRERRPGDPDPFPEPDPVDPDPGDPRPRPPIVDSAAAALFRQVAAAQLNRFMAPPPPPRGAVGAMAVSALFHEAVELTAPRRTFVAAVAGLLTAPPPAPSGEAPLPEVAFAPRFGTPMSRSLAELGQQWLLPGLDGVPANTALALRTNGTFVEAFLVGLNHELGRELAWREFPTPLTATFFDRFWDAAVAPDEPPDIPPLAQWADRALGAPTLRADRFVLLLRSELIRRFPNTVVTAKATTGAQQELLPVFRGSLDPDVSYFGFAIPLDDADDYAIVIAEQPSAPRFGFEVGEAPESVSHAPAPDATAAALAGRLRQRPVRVTIPIAVLLREPES